MRRFKLVNSAGEELDITTKEVFFHEPSGLGFEEDNDFRQIGDFWLLNRTGRNQGTVSGNLIFTDYGNDGPYDKYWTFAKFAGKTPLTLFYNPYRSIINEDDEEDKDSYRRTVRVSRLEKTELENTGALNCPVEFSCYTPWYKIITKDYRLEDPEEGAEDHGFIFGDSTADPIVPPLVFEPTAAQELAGVSPTIFRYEDPVGFTMDDIEFLTDCPAKITIFGPLLNPSWVHRVINGDRAEVAGSGGFSSTVTLEEGDQLVIDGTAGNYAIYRLNANGTKTDLYSKRDFGQTCFINLKAGINQLSVTSSTGSVAKHVIIEGHVYHATV